MKICGIVAEYNPFHNGHRYQAQQARLRGGCDAVVTVMSGPFVQRGEPAIFDKWARTHMALCGGVDAVFELPAFYALQSADWFACGGISVLDGLRLDALSFGSEVQDIGTLRALGRLRFDEPEALKKALTERLKEGLPHPRARAAAIAATQGGADAAGIRDIAEAGRPNAVLGAMYLHWLERLHSAMEHIVVPRVAAGYHDTAIAGGIASATAVRQALERGGDDWRQAVPPEVAQIIDGELEQGRAPDPAALDAMLLYALRSGAPWPDSAEGLHNRARSAAFTAGTAEGFAFAAKSKRYTMARIKRAAMQALLGITPEDIDALRQAKPAYARLLGYSRRMEGLINELAARSAIPFVPRPAQFQPKDAAMARLWHIDLRAGDVYALMMKNPAHRRGERDFTEKMIVV